jgi:hypothetical protein
VLYPYSGVFYSDIKTMMFSHMLQHG